MTKSLVSEEAYRAALLEITVIFERIPGLAPDSPEGQRFDALISDIEDYDSRHFGEVRPITTPEGEVIELSDAVFADMLPGELLFAARDSEQWRSWRTYHVEHLPRATRMLSAAARQRLFERQPGAWKDVVGIVLDALHVAHARGAAVCSEEIESILKILLAMREAGAR